MADYTKSTNFTAKDTTAAPILGAEHDVEYNAIATAIATKIDQISSPTAGNLVSVDSSGNVVDSGVTKNRFPVYGTTEAIGAVQEKTATLAGTVEEVEIVFRNLSCSAYATTEDFLQLGVSGTLQTSGYYSGASYSGAYRYSNPGSGFHLKAYSNSSSVLTGVINLKRMEDTNTWMIDGTVLDSGIGYTNILSGYVTLTGALDTVAFVQTYLTYAFDTGAYWKVNYRRSA